MKEVKKSMNIPSKQELKEPEEFITTKESNKKKCDKIMDTVTGMSIMKNLSTANKLNPKFIFLSGKAGAGKDEVYKMLKELFGKSKTKMVRFSSPIKILTSTIANVPLEDCYMKKDHVPEKLISGFHIVVVILDFISKVWGNPFRGGTDETMRYRGAKTVANVIMNTHKKVSVTLGKIQEILGRDMRKYIGESIWVDWMADDANFKKYQYDPRIIQVVVDGRFKTEATFCKNLGAKMVRLERDLKFRRDYLHGRNPNDPCETDLDDWKEFDIVITNNSSKEELKKKIESIFKTDIKQKEKVKKKPRWFGGMGSPLP